MHSLRLSEHRGHANLGWLDSLSQLFFRPLPRPGPYVASVRCGSSTRTASRRAPGFDTHGHRDMEIVTWVIEGALEHKDSIGYGLYHPAGRIAAR